MRTKPLDQVEEEEEKEGGEMSFLDHLEELRWHLLRSLTAIVVFAIAAFVAKSFVFGVVILGPSRTDFWTYRMMCEASEALNIKAICVDELNFKIQSRKVGGQFFMHISSSIIIGFIMAFPYAFWEIWQFVKPGLYSRERRNARGATFFVSILFTIGVLFGYYILAPFSINFLSSYQLDPSIVNEFDIISYISTLSTLVLACAILFQLPVVVYFFASAGLLTPDLMRKYRRHAIVVILFLSAVLTPPDLISQLLISLPLGALYEMSIYIAGIAEKRYLKAIEMAEEEEKNRKEGISANSSS